MAALHCLVDLKATRATAKRKYITHDKNTTPFPTFMTGERASPPKYHHQVPMLGVLVIVFIFVDRRRRLLVAQERYPDRTCQVSAHG